MFTRTRHENILNIWSFIRKKNLRPHFVYISNTIIQMKRKICPFTTVTVPAMNKVFSSRVGLWQRWGIEEKLISCQLSKGLIQLITNGLVSLLFCKQFICNIENGTLTFVFERQNDRTMIVIGLSLMKSINLIMEVCC